MNHDTARALSKIHDRHRQLERAGIESTNIGWVAVPRALAPDLGTDETAPYTLFGMKVVWIDGAEPFIAVRC